MHKGAFGAKSVTLLNRATRHWYTGSTRRRAISVFRGHRVYESRVGRFRDRGGCYEGPRVPKANGR